jgi:hypothetical protein
MRAAGCVGIATGTVVVGDLIGGVKRRKEASSVRRPTWQLARKAWPNPTPP